jgi:hypothetical protein
MTIALLILHGLIAVALLGAITHQAASVVRTARARPASTTRRTFLTRYSRVSDRSFTAAVAVLFVLSVALGGTIYPAYRIDVRIPFEEMGLAWAVGLFEVKEHWGAVGLGVVPLYLKTWRSEDFARRQTPRMALTLLLAIIVWTDFLVGHLLNNIRGLG